MITFTKTLGFGTLSLQEVLRNVDAKYVTSGNYVADVKSTLIEISQQQEDIDFLDDIGNTICIGYGDSIFELLITHDKGIVYMEVVSIEMKQTDKACFGIMDNTEIITALRSLYESNPPTQASFYYSMGTLDILFKQGMISRLQHHYWLSKFTLSE